MRELNTNEMQVISGAGKIQDTLSGFFSDCFGSIFDSLAPVLDKDCTKDDATKFGTDVGGRIGAIVETHINNLIELLSSWAK